jgi:hypothetical protein
MSSFSFNYTLCVANRPDVTTSSLISQSTGGYSPATFYSVPSGSESSKLAVSFTLPSSITSPWLGIFTIQDAFESPLSTVTMQAAVIRTCGEWSTCDIEAIPSIGGSAYSNRYDAFLQAYTQSYTPLTSVFPMIIGDAPYGISINHLFVFTMVHLLTC